MYVSMLSMVYMLLFQTSVIEGVGELLSEVESSGEIIVSSASESIKDGDVIMTLGRSSLVEAYLKVLARNRIFFKNY